MVYFTMGIEAFSKKYLPQDCTRPFTPRQQADLANIESFLVGENNLGYLSWGRSEGKTTIACFAVPLWAISMGLCHRIGITGYNVYTTTMIVKRLNHILTHDVKLTSDFLLVHEKGAIFPILSDLHVRGIAAPDLWVIDEPSRQIGADISRAYDRLQHHTKILNVI